MKYFLRVLLVLVLAVAIVFGMYYANSKGNTTKQSADITLTTVTKAPVTEKKEDKILLAEYDNGFSLYKQGDTVILKDKEGEYPFEGWSKLITMERPTLYYADFDKDKEKELIFEIASKQREDGTFEHNLYYLDKTKGKYGDDKYALSLISSDTWSFVLKQLVIEEMTQLQCDKIIQFCMASSLETIKYDPKTGINKTGYGGYFKALQNEKTGAYYHVKGWTIHKAETYVNNKNKICVRVYINVTYSDTDQIQQPGYIYFQLVPDDDEYIQFRVAYKSMVFKSMDDSKVSLQHNRALNDWAVQFENTRTGAYTSGDKVIDWLHLGINDMLAVSYSKQDFSAGNTELRNCAFVEITNKHVKIIAKNGYVFDEDMIKRRDFSILINEGMQGDYGENEISYDGKITTDVNGRQVLEIKLDKSYPRGEIHSMKINIPKR